MSFPARTIAAFAVLALAASGCGSSKPASSSTAPTGTTTAAAAPFHVDFSKVPGLQTGPPPWGNEIATLTDRLPFLDLEALPQEALDFHIHQQLDVFLNGKRVTVPASIGIEQDGARPFVTELHTHDGTGQIHNESAVDRPYTLGQLFGEWAVRLDANCLGSYCGHLRWWVGGKRRTGNPANLVLADRQRIVIASGRLSTKRPSTVIAPT